MTLNRSLIFTTLFLFSGTFLFSQRHYPDVQILDSGMKTSLRGISVVNDNVVWVSGSNGMVGRSNNGGKNWKWMSVTGFEKTDFRDIEGFDASTAIIMGIGEPAFILKTTDGGHSWKVVYENPTPGMFLDAMDFSDPRKGTVVGDPVDGHFFMAETEDGGDHWHELPKEKRPKADSGEAFFAASGSNIFNTYHQNQYLVSGGKKSRLFINGESRTIPMIQGKETTGANSVSVWDDFSPNAGKFIVLVGGDFNEPQSDSLNCFYSQDRGKTWKTPQTPPHGYRSSVQYISRTNLVSCGLNGVDYSVDGGKNWKLISTTGFHACDFAKYGSTVYLVGGNGKIGKLRWNR